MRTSGARADVRRFLLNEGFRRVDMTPDEGDGMYTELWRDPLDENEQVALIWGKRKVGS